jgi:hypothetical protein
VVVQGARAWNFFGGQPPAKETSAPAQAEHYYLPMVVRPSTGHRPPPHRHAGSAHHADDTPSRRRPPHRSAHRHQHR